MRSPAPTPTHGSGSDRRRHLAELICRTEFVPKTLRNSAPATAAAIMYGREVGLPPMTSLTQTHVIEGRPAMSAEAMRAMSSPRPRSRVRRVDRRDLPMRARRAGSNHGPRSLWPIDVARAAGLTDKTTGRTTPARCWSPAHRRPSPNGLPGRHPRIPRGRGVRERRRRSPGAGRGAVRDDHASPAAGHPEGRRRRRGPRPLCRPRRPRPPKPPPHPQGHRSPESPGTKTPPPPPRRRRGRPRTVGKLPTPPPPTPPPPRPPRTSPRPTTPPRRRPSLPTRPRHPPTPPPRRPPPGSRPARRCGCSWPA